MNDLFIGCKVRNRPVNKIARLPARHWHRTDGASPHQQASISRSGSARSHSKPVILGEEGAEVGLKEDRFEQKSIMSLVGMNSDPSGFDASIL